MKKLFCLFFVCILCIPMCISALATDSSYDAPPVYDDETTTDLYPITADSGNYIKLPVSSGITPVTIINRVDTPISSVNGILLAEYNGKIYLKADNSYYDAATNALITDEELISKLDTINFSATKEFAYGYTVNEYHTLGTSGTLTAVLNGVTYKKIDGRYYEKTNDGDVLVEDPDLIAQLDETKFSPTMAYTGFITDDSAIIKNFYQSSSLEPIVLKTYYYSPFLLGISEESDGGFTFIHRWWIGVIITIIGVTALAVLPPIFIIIGAKSKKEDDEQEKKEYSFDDDRGLTVSTVSDLENGQVDLTGGAPSPFVGNAKRANRIVYIDHYFFIHITIFLAAAVAAFMSYTFPSVMISLIATASLAFVFAIVELFRGSYLLRRISSVVTLLFLTFCLLYLFMARSLWVWGIVSAVASLVLFAVLMCIAHFTTRKANTAMQAE